MTTVGYGLSIPLNIYFLFGFYFYPSHPWLWLLKLLTLLWIVTHSCLLFDKFTPYWKYWTVTCVHVLKRTVDFPSISQAPSTWLEGAWVKSLHLTLLLWVGLSLCGSFTIFFSLSINCWKSWRVRVKRLPQKYFSFSFHTKRIQCRLLSTLEYTHYPYHSLLNIYTRIWKSFAYCIYSQQLVSIQCLQNWPDD